jgi:membrane protease YdiL (CAAX protease family)
MDNILSFLENINLNILFTILISSLIFIIIIIALNTWVLIDCGNKEPNEWKKKNKWIFIIAVIPFGWLAYIIFRRPKRIKQLGK